MTEISFTNNNQENVQNYITTSRGTTTTSKPYYIMWTFYTSEDIRNLQDHHSLGSHTFTFLKSAHRTHLPIGRISGDDCICV